MPPVLVRMPAAACMPPTSSGLVSWRTRMTCSPAWARSIASSAVNAGRPTAAPGDAGRPRARTVVIARLVGSKYGRRSWIRSPAGIRRIASCSVISFSLTMSQAIFTAAAPVRLPVRVWSIQSLPRSIVNSMSCMSL
jgi:hypothetical protein